MRIIGGTYRGKKLYSPDSGVVRPTSDRARESVFNILHSKFDGNWGDKKLLEVFAGTGAFSLEAISRGVAKVCLIDISTEIAKRNAALFTKEQSKIKLIKADATKLAPSSEKYNLLFSDAPYRKGLSAALLQQVDAKCWLEKGALCVVEVERAETLEIPSCYELLDERTYGISRFLFLEYLA